jgi:hypothetical protein
MVVDRNFLQHPDLEAFLAESHRNKAVINDYASMESFKDDTLENLFIAMDILARHPNQVVILKGTTEACRLRGKRAYVRERMIDRRETREFANFCETMLAAAKGGDSNAIKQLLKRGRAANRQMDELRQNAVRGADSFAKIAGTYSQNEIRMMRQKVPLPPSTLKKLFGNVAATARGLFPSQPNFINFPSLSELPNTLIFRMSLAVHWHAVLWIVGGSPKVLNADKTGRHLIDAIYASYATFFDGFLTRDKKAELIYDLTNQSLDAIVYHCTLMPSRMRKWQPTAN